MNQHPNTSPASHGDSVKQPRNPMTHAIRGFSGGGLIGGAIDALRGRKDTLDGAEAQTAAPAPAPPPATPSMGSDADNYAAQAAKIDAEQRAAGKAKMAAAKPKSFMGKLGFSAGGMIEGPGTPTSDSIPAEVEDTGEPIKVSTGERILSHEQDGFLQKLASDLGFPSLDAMLEAGTGKPVGPTIKDGVPAAAGGASEEEIKNVLNTLAPPPPANPQTMSGSFGSGQRAMQAQAQEAGRPTVPVPAETPGVVRQGSSFSQAPAQAPAQAASAKPVNPMEGGALVNALGGGIDTIKGAAQVGLGAAVLPFANVTDGVKNIAASMLNAKRPDNKGDANAAMSVIQGGMDDFSAAGKEFAIAKKPVAEAVGWTPITQENPLAQAQSQAKPPTAPAAAAPAPASPSAQVAAGAQERTFQTPALAPESVAANGSPNSFTEQNTVMSPRNPLTTMDLAGNNASMARANAIRQELIDSQAGARGEPGSSGGVIADSGRAETNVLMDKWDRENAATKAINAAIANPKSAHAIASIAGSSSANDAARNRDSVDLTTKNEANKTVRRGQDTRLQETSMHSGTVERGQDISAATEANKLSGNPMDNLVKQTSVDVSNQSLKKAQRQDKMVEDIGAEQDPGKRRALMDTLLASQGKNPSEHRYIKVEGGEEVSPDGTMKIKRPSGVYDTITQKFIPMDGGASPAAATVPQGAVDMLKKNPALAADFDKKFGAGAAKKILGK